MRNLTYDFLLKHEENARDAALAAIPEYESTTAWVPKKDAKGNVVLDSDGAPVILEKRVLKREIAKAEWADRIKPLVEKAHGNY
jgi:hypothetical protein